MVTPDRWPAIAAAALRDTVPVHLYEDAVGAGLLRLAELHAKGMKFDRPTHAGVIARNAGIDFVRETLGREGQKSASQFIPETTALAEADLAKNLDDGLMVHALRAQVQDRPHHNDRTRDSRRRHRMVLVMLEAGFSRLEIAAELGISESRVCQMVGKIRGGVA